jgi:hypothetical protein
MLRQAPSKWDFIAATGLAVSHLFRESWGSSCGCPKLGPGLRRGDGRKGPYPSPGPSSTATVLR